MHLEYPSAICDQKKKGAKAVIMNYLELIKLIDLPSNIDERGVLTSIESGVDTPFEIKRLFYMHHINSSRGGHAHRDTDQVVIAISGSFKVDTSDGVEEKLYELNDSTKGLYIPKMVFTNLYDFSDGAICLVLANTHYDMKRSIRTWEDFLKEIVS